MSIKLSVLVPVYNEKDAIKGFFSSLQSAVAKLNITSEIIAINDGSRDGSVEALRSVKGITVLSHDKNKGYGAALKTGIRKSTGEFLMIIDADGTYPLDMLPEMMKGMQQYDMVVGSRTGKSVHIPLFRRPAKFIISKLANFLTGEKIPDLNSGFRVFKRELAEEFFHLFPDGFSFTTTITLASLTNNYSVKYIPINYHKRYGQSSIKPFRDFTGFITLIFRVMLYFRPLKFFMTPGFLLMLLGIAHGIYQEITNPLTGLGSLPIILVLSGLQIIFLGVVADLVVSSRK